MCQQRDDCWLNMATFFLQAETQRTQAMYAEYMMEKCTVCKNEFNLPETNRLVEFQCMQTTDK